nr:MAG TPA: Alternative WD40 repeat motif [Caudoviricetes sp.]
MTLQEVITKLSDLDPEKDYNLSLTGDKLNIETAENEEKENLKKEVEDLKKVNKSLLEKTTLETNESVEDIVANIVGLKKEE